jgi:hypothetical protein
MTTKAVRKCQPSELVRLNPRALFVVVVDDDHALVRSSLSCRLGLQAHVQLKLQLSCLLLGNNALQTTSTGRSSVYQYNHQTEAPHFTMRPSLIVAGLGARVLPVRSGITRHRNLCGLVTTRRRCIC